MAAMPSTSTRPSRADISQARAKRAKRLAAAGSPARLRSVPSPDAATTVSAGPDVAASAPGDTPAFSTEFTTEFTTDLTGEGGDASATGAASGVTAALQSRAERLVGAVLEAAEFNSEARPGPAEIVELAVNVLRAAASSAGVPTDDVERQVAETLGYLRRRLAGDYVVDEFGFDEDYTLNVHLPLLRPFYRKWFRVETRGVENIPDTGGALLVANHSGTIALDSLMTQVAVYDEHPKQRHLRMLGADLVFQTPFVGSMARRSGTTLAANTDAQRLLSGGQLVGVWPEGFKGIGKPFTERYKLQRFGRGGFVAAALRAGVPIIPVSIVGAEEIYPIIGDMPAVARLLGMPYAPVTPTWPLLGPLGLIPLPSKWLIEFGPPIETTRFGPDAADDPMLVFDLTDQVRETIQQTLYSLLMQRKSVFF
ncbi:MAG: acyltransferase family protein [Humibacillus sp.]|nr:acyltransferase family protein [Humibacillus sp.]